MSRRIGTVIAALLGVSLVAWGVSFALQRLLQPPPAAVVDEPPAPPPAAGTPHITATLFYGSRDGSTLTRARREVSLGRTVAEQGRAIVDALLTEPPPAGLVSVIPDGTRLRAFYVTDRGDAFVDLTAEATSAHPGGSHAEAMTVYALVDAVTANLPAVRRVQILIDGHDVETLAGHVDLRRPLAYDISLATAAEGLDAPVPR